MKKLLQRWLGIQLLNKNQRILQQEIAELVAMIAEPTHAELVDKGITGESVESPPIVVKGYDR